MFGGDLPVWHSYRKQIIENDRATGRTRNLQGCSIMAGKTKAATEAVFVYA